MCPSHRLTPLLVRFRPRAGVQAGADALAGRVSRDGPFNVSGPATPTDLVNFGQVQSLPKQSIAGSWSALPRQTSARVRATSGLPSSD